MKEKRKFPKFISPSGQIYTCIAHAVSIQSGWEWYAFESKKLSDTNTEFFGYVMGFENEFGYFHSSELVENNIPICTDPEELQDLLPPIGWLKK